MTSEALYKTKPNKQRSHLTFLLWKNTKWFLLNIMQSADALFIAPAFIQTFIYQYMYSVKIKPCCL